MQLERRRVYCSKHIMHVFPPYKMYIKSQVNLFDSATFFSSHSNIVIFMRVTSVITSFQEMGFQE
ncbi:hypothetical protein DDT52_18085 [Brenneria roseae subsp. roseae]|nr:hypothetical protein DDT52_18085 [Brenneria roseae subsp. roseae]